MRKVEMCRAALVVFLSVAGAVVSATPIHAAESRSGLSSQELMEQANKAVETSSAAIPTIVPPTDDEYLEWPLAKENGAYGSIDGKKLKVYVNELAAISRRYRDEGHQYWGRITGTSADTETRQWIVDKFKKAGVTQITTVEHDLPRQWLPKSWSVIATAGGESFTATSAYPVMMTTPTPAQGLDLEAVYVGTGSAADFIGRDVRGKIVVLYGNQMPAFNTTVASEGGLLRAAAMGAAAIILYTNNPGNASLVPYPFRGLNIPVLTMGSYDGFKVRELLAKPNARIRLSLEIERPDLKTETIFGTLAGATDEKIYIIVHRDGFFEAGSDNGSGLANFIGLADYFGSMPQKNRRRTLVFLAMTGHHNNCTGEDFNCSASGNWVKEHAKELFRNTALIINLEHTAAPQINIEGNKLVISTEQNVGLPWSVNGSPTLVKLTSDAFRAFGVPLYAERERRASGEMAPFAEEAPSIGNVSIYPLLHSTADTAAIIPWTGLEGVGRAYAKIIDGVNAMTIDQLQPPSKSESP